MLEWIPYVLGCVTGFSLFYYLKERPVFECVFCNEKVKHKQPHCQKCGKQLQWDWFRKSSFRATRYQTNESFRKWRMFVPTIEDKQPTE